MSITSGFGNLELIRSSVHVDTELSLEFFGSSGVFSSVSTDEQPETPSDLIAVLGLIQYLDIPFLHITWDPGLDDLGEGATSEVHQSLVSNSINFAYKRTKHASPQAIQALMCEMTILCSPVVRQHPNVLQLQGICWNEVQDDEVDGGVKPILVFEKAHHGNLEEFLGSVVGQKLAFSTRIKLCRDIALALLAMHSSNVIHGDLKPGNVLIFRHDEDEFTAKVADFGYSTMVVKPDRAIYVPKTVPWHAPEHHHRGFLLQNAKRLDFFSLGLLCLWLLFEPQIRAQTRSSEIESGSSAKYTVEMRMSEWLEKLTPRQDLVTHAEQMLHEVSGLVDQQRDDLVKFFHNTLATDAKDRALGINDLIPLLGDQNLQNHFSMLPNNEAGVNNNATILQNSRFQVARSFYEFVKMDIRIRQQLAKSLLARFSVHDQGYGHQEFAFEIAFCFAIGFGVSADHSEADMWLRRSGKQQIDLQERIRSLLTRPTVTRTPLVDFLFANGLFSDVGSLHYHVVDPKHAVLKKVEAECQREITDMRKVFQSGTAYAVLMLRLALPPLIRAQHDLDRAVSTAEKLIRELSDDVAYGPNDFHTLHVKADLAAILSDMGKYTEAIDIERGVAAHIGAALGSTHLATHMSFYSLATTLRKVGNYDEADAIDAAVLKLREERFGPDHHETLMAVNNLGRGAFECGNYKKAETLYRRVIEGLEKVYGANTTKALGSRNNLATVLYKQGKHDQALQLWQSVLDHRTRKFKVNHPRTLDIISKIALIQKYKGNYTAAEGLSRQVLLGRSKILGMSNPDVISSVNNLAICLMAQRKYAEATTLLHKTIASCTTSAQADNPEFITILSNLGTAYQAKGKTKPARRYNEQALRQCRSLLNEDHPTTLVCLDNLAATYNAEGDWSKAQEAFEQVITMKTKKWGRDSPSTLISLANLSVVFENQDKLEASEDLLREVLAGRLKATDGELHPTTLKNFHDLARILFMRKKFSEAKEMAQKAALGRENLFGARDRLTLESKALLSFIPADDTEDDTGCDDVAISDDDPE